MAAHRASEAVTEVIVQTIAPDRSSIYKSRIMCSPCAWTGGGPVMESGPVLPDLDGHASRDGCDVMAVT